MPKASSKSKREVSDSDTSDSGPDDVKPVKKAKKSEPSGDSSKKSSGASGKSSCEVVNGEPTWQVGPKRYAKIRTFKGRQYVDVREYWNDDKGDLKPGKKGISMSMEQWDMFTQIIPEINQRL